MLLKQLGLPSLLKDQRIRRIGGNLLRKSVKCFWCNRCLKLNKKKLRDSLNMQQCVKMVLPAQRICLRQIPRHSQCSSMSLRRRLKMHKRLWIKPGDRKMRKPMNSDQLQKKSPFLSATSLKMLSPWMSITISNNFCEILSEQCNSLLFSELHC